MKKGDVLACRDCGSICLKPYPAAVSRGDWIYVNDVPPYALCGSCHLAQTRRILGRRSA